jgi:hypothetical protein
VHEDFMRITFLGSLDQLNAVFLHVDR